MSDWLLNLKSNSSIIDSINSILRKSKYEAMFNVNLTPKMIFCTSRGINARVNSNNKSNWAWFIMLHKLVVDAGFIKLANVTTHKDAPSEYIIVVLSVWDVLEVVIKDPDFKVLSELCVLHTEAFELEQICQFCTWHLMTVNLISFSTDIDVPETEDTILKEKYVLSKFPPPTGGGIFLF